MKSISDIITGLFRMDITNGFVKNVFILLSWSVFAQIISFSVSPVLSRLYSPDDFGVFANFISIVFILGIISTGKLEAAIVIPEKKRDSLNVVYSIVALALFFFTISLSIATLLYFYNIELFGFTKALYFLIPGYLLIFGIYQSAYYFGNREKKYKILGKSRALQALIVALSSVLIAYYSDMGLIYGFVIAILLATIYLVLIVFREVIFHTTTLTEIKLTIARNINFVKYSTISGVFNSFSNIGLPLIISLIFNPFYTGLYFFSNKIVRLPLNLLFSSLSQVYFQESARLYKSEPKRLYKLTRDIQRKILYTTLPFLILMSIVSPYLFGYVFGEEWVEAGALVKYYALFVFFNSLYSPISSIIDILGLQKLELYFNISLATSQILSLWISSYYVSFEYSLLIFSIIGTGHYLGISIYLDRLLKWLY